MISEESDKSVGGRRFQSRNSAKVEVSMFVRSGQQVV